MSAPSDGARAGARKARIVERVAADERVVDVLDEHFIMWRDLEDKEGPPGEWYCSCGAKFGFSHTAIRHVAEALAGVIADAKAEERERVAAAIEATGQVCVGAHGPNCIGGIAYVDAARIARAES